MLLKALAEADAERVSQLRERVAPLALRAVVAAPPLAAELNDASDAFTDELRSIEKELARLNLGVEVEGGRSN
jgi:hypothetical protein